jgi:hypothetical protein
MDSDDDSDDGADDPVERINLLRRLDPLVRELAYKALDPEFRTIAGRALTTEEGDLLLSCTVDDIWAAADAINAEARLFAERQELFHRITTILQPLAQPGEGWEATLARMAPQGRREVRRLINHLSSLSPPPASDDPTA